MTLADRLATALARAPAPGVRLLPGDDRVPDPLAPAPVPAAVLIAITDRADPGVILTQRTETLRSHAGQIAFPGGRIDPIDAGPAAAALREAHEEIALPSDAVTLIGAIEPYRTITGFEVTPIVGVVPPDLPLRASEGEVASVFEVPLGYLFDPVNHLKASMEWQGSLRHYYEIWWRERRIWGATAAIIINLAQRMQWM